MRGAAFQIRIGLTELWLQSTERNTFKFFQGWAPEPLFETGREHSKMPSSHHLQPIVDPYETPRFRLDQE